MKNRQSEELIAKTMKGDLYEDAKKTALELYTDMPDAGKLFYEKNLDKVEKGIKSLNEFGSKCWLISAITLYAIVYDTELYLESGLTWSAYLAQSRERLGMDPRDVTEQLSSARFFIKYHRDLQKAGWSPIGSGRKLARAELALELSGDINETIKHLATDTWQDFNEWYSSFKLKPALPAFSDQNSLSQTISYKKGSIVINGEVACSISNEISKENKLRLESYLKKIVDAMKEGAEPVIIPVHNSSEADALLKLRDKNQQNK